MKEKVLQVSKQFLIGCLVIVLIYSFVNFVSSFTADAGDDDLLAEVEIGDNSELLNFAYIAGGVKSPGVYEISENDVLIDLVNKAGGFTEDANTIQIEKSVNLSKRVFNEDHFYIPTKFDNQQTAPQISDGSDATIQAGNQSSGLINVNTASLDQLTKLDGVGPSTAQKIIDARPYSKKEDLLNVSGIGDSTYEKFKDSITVN